MSSYTSACNEGMKHGYASCQGIIDFFFDLTDDIREHHGDELNEALAAVIDTAFCHQSLRGGITFIEERYHHSHYDFFLKMAAHTVEELYAIGKKDGIDWAPTQETEDKWELLCDGDKGYQEVQDYIKQDSNSSFPFDEYCSAAY
jgi:hypothetical protein